MNLQSILEQLAKWNDTLWGLPSGVLIFVFVLALCLALRWWKLFSDRYIPPTASLVGTLGFCMLAPDDSSPWRIWLFKNIVVGFIIAFSASLVALKFGHKLPIIGKYIKEADDGDQLKKPTE